MDLTVNGKLIQLDLPVTGKTLLDHLQIPVSAVVVELNGDIIARDLFVDHNLANGDVLELVTIVGGG